MGGSKVVGGVFQDGDAGGNNFWGGDVGVYPLHEPGPGGVPTQGRYTDHWESDPEVIFRELVISTSVDGDA